MELLQRPSLHGQTVLQMSLYYETAPYISLDGNLASLKSRLFDSTKEQTRSSPKQIYALASEAALWSPVLAEVIENSQLLDLERKLSPELALLLTHDLLLTKRGISAPASHVLRQAVERHKARLRADFVKARLQRGCSTFDQLREALKEKAEHPQTADGAPGGQGLVSEASFRPRWIRVNTCKTSMKVQLDTTFKDFVQVQNLQDFSSSTPKSVLIDKHIPNLIALLPSTEITKSSAYTSGLLIFQDKASCFPAYLLDPLPEHGDIVDACAAPGNKSTHLAAILQEKFAAQQASNTRCTIHACERDITRAAVLQTMTTLASSPNQSIKIHAGQDFLHVNPHRAPWNTITSLLLDPSCSGSGIIGRDDDASFPLKVTLPRRGATAIPATNGKGKKRKRKPDIAAPPATASLPTPMPTIPTPSTKPLQPTPTLKDLTARLASLQAFQLRLVLHAFAFPLAQRITYSTCSIHAQENEHVVVKALASEVAQTRGWRMLEREEQIDGMKGWGIRGLEDAVRDVADQQLNMEEKEGLVAEVGEIAEACIRCEKGTKEGTQGFFVAAFVREDEVGGIRAEMQGASRNGARRHRQLSSPVAMEDIEEEEWEGFGE